MTRSTWRFHALDTLFFRDARPHSSAGASILTSLFPPSARTVAGAVRFLIGSALGADWAAFGKAREGEPVWVGDGDKVDLMALIGRGDDYGSLRIQGPWLAAEIAGEWRRLYPAPRTLLIDDEDRPVDHLKVGPAVDCDLGRLHLPRMPRGRRSADELWLEAEAYRQVCQGELPSEGVYRARDLFARETRLGIVRSHDSHAAAEGLLYQTRHVRPGGELGHPRAAPTLAIEIGLTGGEGLPGTSLPSTDLSSTVAPMVRLGGEGRLAAVAIEAEDLGIPPAPEPRRDTLGLVLNLLTPADLAGGWRLPGFEPSPGGEASVASGTLHDVHLRLHTAAVGRAIRQGGWDLAANQPRPVRSLMPAGSAFYVTVTDAAGVPLHGEELRPAIEALHGAQLKDDPLGQGQLAVGLFDATTFPHLEDFS